MWELSITLHVIWAFDCEIYYSVFPLSGVFFLVLLCWLFLLSCGLFGTLLPTLCAPVLLVLFLFIGIKDEIIGSRADGEDIQPDFKPKRRIPLIKGELCLSGSISIGIDDGRPAAEALQRLIRLPSQLWRQYTVVPDFVGPSEPFLTTL